MALQKIKGIRTDYYKVDEEFCQEGYILEIQTDIEKEMYEAYLQHMSYGVKKLLFGMQMGVIPYADFKKVIEDNLFSDIQNYEQMMEEDADMDDYTENIFIVTTNTGVTAVVRADNGIAAEYEANRRYEAITGHTRTDWTAYLAKNYFEGSDNALMLMTLN